MNDVNNPNVELATLGGGCFWCIEAVFAQQPGVLGVESGYAGGHDSNPTYRNVCSGNSGHAEVIQISFDPKIISYESLLELFWQAHDPTTLNRQGNDVGTQYRSVIYFHDDEQKETALRSRHTAQARFNPSIVTQIEALDRFFPAEKYHQNYYVDNPGEGYCSYVIKPKLKKLGLKY